MTVVVKESDSPEILQARGLPPQALPSTVAEQVVNFNGMKVVVKEGVSPEIL